MSMQRSTAINVPNNIYSDTQYKKPAEQLADHCPDISFYENSPFLTTAILL